MTLPDHYSSLGVLGCPFLPREVLRDEDPAVADLTEPPTGSFNDPQDPMRSCRSFMHTQLGGADVSCPASSRYNNSKT